MRIRANRLWAVLNKKGLIIAVSLDREAMVRYIAGDIAILRLVSFKVWNVKREFEK